MRRLDETNKKLDAVVVKLEESYVRQDVYQADFIASRNLLQTLVERIKKMEDRFEWLVRAVAGILIAAVLTVLFTSGFN
jgi:hypothetical protein